MAKELWIETVNYKTFVFNEESCGKFIKEYKLAYRGDFSSPEVVLGFIGVNQTKIYPDRFLYFVTSEYEEKILIFVDKIITAYVKDAE